MESSEEEMIKIDRKSQQQGRKRTLEELFEEREEENEELESTESGGYEDENSLFLEIFGTGEEYKYVLEESSEKTVEELSVASSETKEMDVEDVCEYVVGNVETDPECVRRIVGMIVSGYSIHFALMHGSVDSVGIEEGYRIVDVVGEYKEFRTVLSGIERQYGSTGLVHGLKSVRCLRWYVGYRRHLMLDLAPCRELLSAEEFCENLRMGSKLHEPEETVGFGEYSDEERLVQRISLHPIFRDKIYKMYKDQGVYEDDRLVVRDSDMWRDVTRLYLGESSLAGDEWNKYRERIVEQAVRSVVSEGFVEQISRERRSEEMKRRVFTEVVDRIVNGGVGVHGVGSYVCGVTEDKRYVRAVMVDFLGEEVDSVTIREGEEDLLVEFVGRFKPHCVAVSGTSTAVKNVMRTVECWNAVFVENRIAKMVSRDGHEFSCNVARMVQCPEIEYSNLVSKGIVYVNEPLARNELVETVRRGIVTAVAIVGIDVNYLVDNKRGGGLMSLIGMDEELRQRLNGLGHVPRLNELKEVCGSTMEYENITTYLRITPGVSPQTPRSEVLDSTSIHPNNYETARSLCARWGGRENDTVQGCDPVSDVLRNNKEILRSVEADVLGDERDPLALSIYKSLVHNNRPVYSGLPDHLVFRELGGREDLVGKTVEGKVVKCGEGFYILGLDDSSVVVYVRRNRLDPELFLNQLVHVRIDHVNDFLLSYTGSIATQEQRKTKHLRFTTHPLFRNVNSRQAEEYLRENSQPLLLRMSGRDGSPVVVLKILDDVYVHMKIEESGRYYYRGRPYDDIDEFISRVAKKILVNVRNIKAHKYYFGDERSVLEYLDGGGSYIRYGFYFSRQYPGKLCMLYRAGRDHKEYIGVGESLTYESREFRDLDEFMRYRKSV